MQISRSSSGLVGAVGSLLGGLLARDEDSSDVQPQRTNARLEAIDKVRAFVQRFDIDPRPETYAFLY